MHTSYIQTKSSSNNKTAIKTGDSEKQLKEQIVAK